MSSALVRQALAFVDEDESQGKQKKRPRNRGSIGQANSHTFKAKNKKSKEEKKSTSVEDNIKKLLALSKSATESDITKKIVERAVKRKPLAGTIEEKQDTGESILFPEEKFKDFEKEYFCS